LSSVMEVVLIKPVSSERAGPEWEWL